MGILDKILALSEELPDEYDDYEYETFEKTKKPTRRKNERFSDKHAGLENVGRELNKTKEELRTIQSLINRKKNTSEDLSNLYKRLEEVGRKLKRLENKKNRICVPRPTIQEYLENYEKILNEESNQKEDDIYNKEEKELLSCNLDGGQLCGNGYLLMKDGYVSRVWFRGIVFNRVFFGVDAGQDIFVTLAPHFVTKEYWRKNFLPRYNPNRDKILERYDKTGVWKIK